MNIRILLIGISIALSVLSLIWPQYPLIPVGLLLLGVACLL